MGEKREENCEICAAVIIKRLLTAKFNISCIHHYDNMQLHKHSYIGRCMRAMGVVKRSKMLQNSLEQSS